MNQDLIYKTFDAFNPFLAASLDVVLDALYLARLTTMEDAGRIASAISKALGAPIVTLFERIRSKTFDVGLRLAGEIPVGSHPLTQVLDGETMLRTAAYVENGIVVKPGTAAADLVDHAKFWRRWLGDGLGPVYKLYGGLSKGELLKRGC